MRFILVLVMLFSIFFSITLYAETINRVIAYVDNIAITLEDFRLELSKVKEKIPDINNEEILGILINRTILLKKARELFVEGSEEDIINSYVDLKIKSSIIISENQIRQYYEDNKSKMENKPYISVRNDIEKYLFEKEFNKKLKEHIEELKEISDIKIVFIP